MSDMKPDAATAETNHEGNENPEINAEQTLKKKYGGLVPKKPPLISKDHERAYFDSADWALGKQGAGAHPHKPKGPLEALRPKLQEEPVKLVLPEVLPLFLPMPTNQQTRSRRTPYASSENLELGNADDLVSNEVPNDDNISEEKNKDAVAE